MKSIESVLPVKPELGEFYSALERNIFTFYKYVEEEPVEWFMVFIKFKNEQVRIDNFSIEVSNVKKLEYNRDLAKGSIEFIFKSNWKKEVELLRGL